MLTSSKKLLIDLVRDTMRAKNLKRIKVWWEAVDGNIDTDHLEIDDIEMIDDMGFEWGCDEIEQKFVDLELEAELDELEKGCYHPSYHHFEKKMLLQPYRQCRHCGYSPELDGCKPDFAKIHQEFLDYENRRKP